MVTIEWTQEALSWLEDIHYYIAQDNRRAATRIIKEIYKKVEILKTFPLIGYTYENEEDLNIRILLYGHYRIAYWIKDENSIYILGVFHGALDIERYLK